MCELVMASLFADLTIYIWKGRPHRIKLHLASGGNPDLMNEHGWTLLMVAAASGRIPIVNALLDAGADVHHQSPYGHTPLIAATFMGRGQVMDLLMARGAQWEESSAVLQLTEWLLDGKQRHKVEELMRSAGASIAQFEV
jgi:ankyrin repeat protein